MGIFFGRVVAIVLGGAGGGTDAFVRFRSSDIFDRVYALHCVRPAGRAGHLPLLFSCRLLQQTNSIQQKGAKAYISRAFSQRRFISKDWLVKHRRYILHC